jgi:hypothetical protein
MRLVRKMTACLYNGGSVDVLVSYASREKHCAHVNVIVNAVLHIGFVGVGQWHSTAPARHALPQLSLTHVSLLAMSYIHSKCRPVNGSTHEPDSKSGLN